MRKILYAALVGLAVAIVVFFGFASYTWTAIHSGWSQAGIDRFYAAMWIVPLVVGLATGFWWYWMLRRRPGSLR